MNERAATTTMLDVRTRYAGYGQSEVHHDNAYT
jgi:hypothetical protein